MDKHLIRGSSRKPNLKRKGFSLVEMLVVVVIVGLLAALVGPAIYNRLKPARKTVALAQMQNVGKALDSFFIDVGRYPTSDEGLVALTRGTLIPNWNGPYITKDLPADPWGNAYVYKAPGQDNRPYDLTSMGTDGKPGGDKDGEDLKL